MNYNFLNKKGSYNPLDKYNVKVKNSKQDLLEKQSNIQSSLNNLFMSKYGVEGFDVNKGWNQDNLKPISGWDDLQEAQGLNVYNKYMDDLYNTKQALSQYDMINQNQMQNLANANVIKEQAEKYIPNQLAMQGMGNVGTSESSLVGIGNNYMRNISEINKGADSKVGNLLGMYDQAMQDSNVGLANQQYNTLAEYQDIAFKQTANLLDGQTDQEGIDRILNNAKGKISPSQYEYLVERAKIISKAIESTKLPSLDDFVGPPAPPKNEIPLPKDDFVGPKTEDNKKKADLMKKKAFYEKLLQDIRNGKLKEDYDKTRLAYEEIMKQLYELTKK